MRPTLALLLLALAASSSMLLSQPEAERVIEIGAPGVMDQPGATYLLTRDVTAPRTAFVVKGDGITLDLGGHTVTYGTDDGDRHSGVFARPGEGEESFPHIPREGFGGASNFMLRNGRIVQGGGDGGFCHAVYMRAVDGLEIYDTVTQVRSRDSDNFYIRSCGSVRIHHNDCISTVKEVSNRHYPGQDVIVFWGVDGPVEIDHNGIHGGAQWGINVHNKGRKPYLVDVHHNLVKHRSYATNGYGLGCHADNMYVHHNAVIPVAGRGVHLTARGIEFFSNIVDVREKPNPEYPRTRSHGVKLEGATSTRVHHNLIRSTAEEGFGDADPLDFDVPAGAHNEVYRNTVVALRKTDEFWAATTNLISQVDGSGCVVHDNIFRTNHWHIRVDWGGGSGMLFRDNRYEVIGEPEDYQFFSIRPGRAYDVKNDIFRDNVLVPPASYDRMAFMYRDYLPERMDIAIESTLTVLATDPAGLPIGNVVVARSGPEGELRAATDSSGTAKLLLVPVRYVGNEKRPYGPYSVTLSKPDWDTVTRNVDAAQPLTLPVTMTSRTAKLHVYAGPDQRRLIDDVAQLDGRVVPGPAAGDAEPQVTWRQTRGPQTTLDDPHSLSPRVKLPAWGGYDFELEVVLPDGAKATDKVYVRANRTLTPTAVASAPETANVGTIVELDGASSSDPVGFPLSYHWRQTGGPSVELSSAEFVTPIFVPTEPGRHSFELVVANPLAKRSDPAVVGVDVER